MATALTGVSATGAVGQVRAFVSPGESFGLRFPAIQLAMTGVTGATGDLALTTPVVTLAMTGDVPELGTLALTLPKLTVALAGFADVVGTLTLRVPAPRMSMGDGNALVMRVPKPSLVMAGTAGITADLSLRMPVPRLALVGDVPVIGELSLPLVAPRLRLDGTVGGSGRLGIQLRAITLAMQGATGALGTLTLRVPVVTFAASGYYEATGTLDLTLPAVHLALTGGAPQDRSGGGAAPVTDTNTLVMHTERLSLTQYTNYPFNSFARFAGIYIGASDQGVFALTGNTDNGTLIQAIARGGITDFGTSFVKRVDRMYVGYRADGPMILRVITDEGAVRDYGLPAPRYSNAIHGAHVRMGRGVESRYWQFELRNRNGADLSLDIIELKPTKLRRRVGGRDA